MKEKHDAIKARLQTVLETARQRANAERGSQDLRDFVTLRAIARDCESTAAAALAGLTCDSQSIAAAEEIAVACEQSLAITPEKMREDLRNGRN